MTLAAPAPPVSPPPAATKKIGPQDHGSRMSLAEFDRIQVVEGYHYELSRGVIQVSDIPIYPHAAQFLAVRNQLVIYDYLNPGLIHAVFGAGETKTMVEETESERHPDISVYLTPPPPGDQPWAEWTAEIVVEIVSKSSAKRDYTEKPEDYLAAGVKEYWIIDRFKRLLTVLTRAADGWDRREYGPDQPHATPLLPGFALLAGPLFDAAGK